MTPTVWYTLQIVVFGRINSHFELSIVVWSQQITKLNIFVGVQISPLMASIERHVNIAFVGTNLFNRVNIVVHQQ